MNLSRKKNILLIGSSGEIANAIINSLDSEKVRLITASRSNNSNRNNFLNLDLSDQDSIKKFCERIKSRYIYINAIIFVSGKSISSSKQNEVNLQDPETFEDLINVNLISIYTVIYNIQENIMPDSSIIFISSIGAHKAFPNNPGYQASKAGLEALSRSLAVDLSHKRVRVNSLALGYFKTSMTENSFNNEKLQKERSSRTILKRWGEPEEITGIINLLLGDKSTYITGSTIFIDGGWNIKGL